MEQKQGGWGKWSSRRQECQDLPWFPLPYREHRFSDRNTGSNSCHRWVKCCSCNSLPFVYPRIRWHWYQDLAQLCEPLVRVDSDATRGGKDSLWEVQILPWQSCGSLMVSPQQGDSRGYNSQVCRHGLSVVVATVILSCTPVRVFFEHFFARLTTWHARSWSQHETLCTRLWLDVFWTLWTCQILTFWLCTTVHVLYDLHTSAFPTREGESLMRLLKK